MVEELIIPSRQELLKTDIAELELLLAAISIRAMTIEQIIRKKTTLKK